MGFPAKIFAVTAIAVCASYVAMGSMSAASLPPSYLVVDSQTGYVLIEQNAREKRQVGSLTKIATACVVLDWAEKKGGDLNQLATISEATFVGVEKNEIGWQVGDVVSLRDLLYAAVVQSDNLAANAIANRVAEALFEGLDEESSEVGSEALLLGKDLARQLERSPTNAHRFVSDYSAECRDPDTWPGHSRSCFPGARLLGDRQISYGHGLGRSRAQSPLTCHRPIAAPRQE